MRPTTVPRRHGGRNRMTYASYSRSPETRPAFLNSEANVLLRDNFGDQCGNQFVQRVLRRIRVIVDGQIDSLLVQEGEGYRHRGALVAIRERVVLCKMEDEMRHLSEQIGK